jgi:outer membrane protein TolC
MIKFKNILVTMLLAMNASALLAQTVRSYDLQQIIDLSLERSLATKISLTKKENRQLEYSNFRTTLRPQLRLNGNLFDYSQDYLNVIQPDGSIIFQPRSQNYTNLGLSLSQPITETGGTVSMNSQIARYDDYNYKYRQYSGIPVNISLNQPIFAFNSFKWEKKIAPLRLAEAQKDFNKEMFDIAYVTTSAYFAILAAQIDYQLAERNITNQQSLYDIERKRIEMGTTSKDKLLQMELKLLNLKQDFSKAGVGLKTAYLSLKSYSGINDSLSLQLAIPEDLPDLDTLQTKSLIAMAKINRPDVVGFQRRKLEAERDLEKAKRERFEVNLKAAYGYNNVSNRFSNVYVDPNSQKSLSLGISVPLLDWGRNKNSVALARSNMKLLAFTLEQEERNIEMEITNTIENLKLIRKSILTAKQADSIAEQRYKIAFELYRFGKMSVTDLNISQEEKDRAKRAFVDILRDFWLTYYRLRVLTVAK